MSTSKILTTVFLFLVIVIVESRVRQPNRQWMRHPQILTRPPPAPSSPKPAKLNAAAAATTKTTTTTTTTTAEPPEVEEPEASVVNTNPLNYFYDFFDPLAAIGPFGDYGNGIGYLGGAMSAEVDDDSIATTTIQPRGRSRGWGRGRGRGRGHRRRQNQGPVSKKPTKVTTEKPTTSEPDDDIVGSSGSGTAGSNGATGSGYCFCSPAQTCPSGSIPRGGYCWNFLSKFTNLIYRRCCYRPSLARRFNL